MATNPLVILRQLTGKQKLLYGAGALFGLAILAPAAVLALKTVTSIAMALVVGLGLFIGFMALPLILRWWRIQVFKMLTATARRNPVETLRLELIDRQTAFQVAGRKVVAVSAKRDSLREKLSDYERKHEAKDEALENMISKLSQLVDRLRASLRQTGVKLDEFGRFVERQADRWELAKETGELAATLREAQGDDVTTMFLANTAIDTIRIELNTSFAEIDYILEGDEVKAIVDGRQATTRNIHPADLELPKPVMAREA